MKEIKYKDIVFKAKSSCKSCTGKGFTKCYEPNTFNVEKQYKVNEYGKNKIVKTFHATQQPKIDPCQCLVKQIRKKIPKSNWNDYGFAPLVVEGIKSIVVVHKDLLVDDEEEKVEESVKKVEKV